MTDVSYLTKEQVRDTFIEDFKETVAQAARNHSVTFSYAHPRDSERLYEADARVNGTTERPILLFAIANNEQCQTATIKAHQWEHWGERFKLYAVFREQTEINRVILARFSDVAERQFSSLESARERLQSAIDDVPLLPANQP